MAEGHRQRMRERFYKEGLDNFEPHEVLEMLLYFSVRRKDTNTLAHNLIEQFGSFHGVLEADRESLMDFGLSDTTAALLNMMPAFSNFYIKSHTNGIKKLASSDAIGEYAVGKVGMRTHEVFGVICLTVQMNCINFEIIAEGTVASSEVSARKVVECAVRNKASNVIFVHNHPGGSLAPSESDKKLTKYLRDLLKAIDIIAVDHIIVANGKYLSMLEIGAM